MAPLAARLGVHSRRALQKPEKERAAFTAPPPPRVKRHNISGQQKRLFYLPRKTQMACPSPPHFTHFPSLKRLFEQFVEGHPTLPQRLHFFTWLQQLEPLSFCFPLHCIRLLPFVKPPIVKPPSRRVAPSQRFLNTPSAAYWSLVSVSSDGGSNYANLAMPFHSLGMNSCRRNWASASERNKSR